MIHAETEETTQGDNLQTLGDLSVATQFQMLA